jgi:CRP/FNR family cyclic AMP-dependent transcriptional regulator
MGAWAPGCAADGSIASLLSQLLLIWEVGLPFARKNKDAKVRLLNGVSLFSACSRGELGRIASLVDQVEIPAGKVLAREGEPGWEFFVIAEGKAKATKRGRKVASFGRGSFFGEMSLLDQGPRSATVTAETDMQLLVLDSRRFSALVEDHPSVSRKLLRGMAERLRGSETVPTH